MACAVGVVWLVLAPTARADHHEVKITEVFPGTVAAPGNEFVELQMYTGGQNNFAPAASLTFYNASGGTFANLDLPDVLDGTSQRTLLSGTAGMEGMFTVQADSEYAGDFIAGSGGGVCLVSDSFGTIDCVAWGSATVPGAGLSEPAIPDGSSIERSILAGCNTLLDPGDDSGSSFGDFVPASPNPRPNSVTPTENSCPNTVITKKPRQKSTDRTPVFKFAGGDSYGCVLDGEDTPCAETFKPPRLKLGKHKIAVTAEESDESVDGTPAKYSWKIVRKR